MTIGADFALKETTVIVDGEPQKIKFQIWDLAGQPRFGSVRNVYYLGCLGALVVFDLTRPDTFQNLVGWIQEIWQHNGKGVIPIVILGNKADLLDEYPNHVPLDTAQKFAEKLTETKTRKYGFEVKFLQTSAKTGLNIEEAFNSLAQVYFQYVKQSQQKSQ